MANTLKSQDGRGWSHDVEATYVAAPLSHGSNPNSNMAGGRREDDVNLVAGNPDVSGTLKGFGKRGWDNSAESADRLVTAYHFRTREKGDCFEETEVNVSRASVGGSGGAKLAIDTGSSVRRLTPTECERLQGFPDGWTQLGGTADSKRYAALGDAVTVPVAEWIGHRIMAA